MAVAPWIVSDGLWQRIEPLLPKRQRRFRYPGRKPVPDRQALQAILFVLHTEIAWRHLPLELGFGSGSTCYRRMVAWQQAGVGPSPVDRARPAPSTTSWSTRPASRSPGRSPAATATT